MSIPFFRGQARKARRLSRGMRTEAAAELLEQALKDSIENPAYFGFFQGELEHVANGDGLKRLDHFVAAHELAPGDSFLAWNVGHALASLGRNDEAVEWFEKALELNPADNEAMREMGILLARQKRDEEALAWYARAVQAYPEDHASHRRAAESHYRLGDLDTALESIVAAFRISPDTPENLIDLKFLCSVMDRDLNALIRDIRSQDEGDVRLGLTELRTLADGIKAKFGPKIKEYIAKKDAVQSKLSHFLAPESSFPPDRSFFMVLRKWNSYTPVVPSLEQNDKRVGGGYFILHKGIGTVIDPGYNFIENFSKAGGKIIDIHNVVITHAHNDHTNDFESIMTLLHQFNQVNKHVDPPVHKRINVYMNVGSFMKFSGLLDLRGCPYFNNVVVMNPGDVHTLGPGMVLTALTAYHDELITRSYAVGLHFAFDFEGLKRNLLFTSDTGLFPPKLLPDNRRVADVEGPEVYRNYPVDLSSIDLLVPHIGSIKEGEIDPTREAALEEVIYPNHLGLIGTARVTTAIRPRVAVISEFGEELKGFLDDLALLLQDMVEGYFGSDGGHVPIVLPGDVSFVYDIENPGAYCVVNKCFVDCATLGFRLSDDTYFYFDRQAAATTDMEGCCLEFLMARRTGEAYRS